MIVSSKGRYALRVMVTLAQADPDTLIPSKDLAEAQAISSKYLESIMTMLSKAELVEGVQGKGGGYRLVKDPTDSSVADILLATERTLAPVACLEPNSETCQRADSCPTLEMWEDFYQKTLAYFQGISLADLINKDA